MSHWSGFQDWGGGLRSADRGRLMSGGRVSDTWRFISRSNESCEDEALESIDKIVDG